MLHDRPLDAKVQVHPGMFRLRIENEVLTNVHPTGETDATIDDHDLAVVAQVERR